MQYPINIGIVPDTRSFLRPTRSISAIPTSDPTQKLSEATPPRMSDKFADIPNCTKTVLESGNDGQPFNISEADSASPLTGTASWGGRASHSISRYLHRAVAGSSG